MCEADYWIHLFFLLSLKMPSLQDVQNQKRVGAEEYSERNEKRDIKEEEEENDERIRSGHLSMAPLLILEYILGGSEEKMNKVP